MPLQYIDHLTVLVQMVKILETFYQKSLLQHASSKNPSFYLLRLDWSLLQGKFPDVFLLLQIMWKGDYVVFEVLDTYKRLQGKF